MCGNKNFFLRYMLIWPHNSLYQTIAWWIARYTLQHYCFHQTFNFISAKKFISLQFKFCWAQFEVVQYVSSQKFVCYCGLCNCAQALLHIWNNFHQNQQQQWSWMPSKAMPDIAETWSSLPCEIEHSAEVSTRETCNIICQQIYLYSRGCQCHSHWSQWSSEQCNSLCEWV